MTRTLIDNLEHDNFLAVDTQGCAIRLVIGQVDDAGCVVRMERAVAQQLRDALTEALDEDGREELPAQSVQSYREWFYWAAQIGNVWYPKIDNPDTLDGPVTLPMCASREQAIALCMAHIDKQHAPVDDGPPVIG